MNFNVGEPLKLPFTIPDLENLTMESFKDTYKTIIEWKKTQSVSPIIPEPDDDTIRKWMKPYSLDFKNGSVGVHPNIESRSKANTYVVDTNNDLEKSSRMLMLYVLELMIKTPLIQTDQYVGTHDMVRMHRRSYVDGRFASAILMSHVLFPKAPPSEEPDAETLFLPSYWPMHLNPKIPGTDLPMAVMRMSDTMISIVTGTHYGGEWKKDALTQWNKFVFEKGGLGEHASLKEMEVKYEGNDERIKKFLKDGWRRITLQVYSLTGGGKSTHGLYVLSKENKHLYQEKFGIDLTDITKNQFIKNDDMTGTGFIDKIGTDLDRVYSPEQGSWTKTEDVDINQIGIYKAGMASHAFHENTEWDTEGNPSFAGTLYRYGGRLNQNARTTLRLQDTGFFDGNVNSTGPSNMIIFVSPGYLTDFAWVKIQDLDIAAAIYGAGRTVGHPAQSAKGIGEEKFSPNYNDPFIMGKEHTAANRTIRYREYFENRRKAADEGSSEPLEIYLINTTGKIGTKITSENGKNFKPVFEEVKRPDGTIKKKPVGGTGPTIEETELFIHMAAAGRVKYEPHPIYGKKVLIPVKVPGLSDKRIKELNPFNHHDMDIIKAMLKEQVDRTKAVFDKKLKGLPQNIYNALDF